MVFTNLGTNEKDAFFSLLDEYFASRPEILNAQSQDAPPAANAANSNPFRKEITGAQAHVAAAAVGRASNSAAKYMSAGIKNLRGSSPNNTGGGGAGGGASGPETAGQQQQQQRGGGPDNMETQSGGSLADRIAALQAAKQTETGGSTNSAPSTKGFGGMDTSAVKNAFGSMKNSFSNPTKTTQSPPSRFTPPVTRAAAPPQPEPEPEPEEQGDWAEAQYDYESAEPGDLELKEGQRVLVIERTSGDWWTGEMNGKKGLFPASYVKLL
ncbi:hypothetical protein Agabi119p4_5184 [Agaricus bisporus var. burnettii]|uniref:SH3 domain-containing protein n=1 Tax=Agaricus bisporus var. burnettii TaxID=192524 RepID=A0A8H7KI06_AGABI|nr:hypothetical protein Agabi119p4_5184 [Agaricus bisporus var. burnettii]